MGVEVRKIEKGPCKCFLFPAGKDQHPGSLCFTKGVVGALDEHQERDYCTDESFKPERNGGIAIDLGHPDPRQVEKVENLIRTMRQFSTGVEGAHLEYALIPREERRRDLDEWRNQYVARNIHAVAVGRPIPNEKDVILPDGSVTKVPREYRGHRRARKKNQKALERKALPPLYVQGKAYAAEKKGRPDLAKQFRKQLE